MAKLNKGNQTPWSDLVWTHSIGSIDPKDYMLAHFAGITARYRRKQMYKEMLAHGIDYHNDELAHAGLQGLLVHIFKQRQTSNESVDDLLEPLWNEEKENALLVQAGIAIDLFEEIATTFRFYSREPDSSDGYTSSQFNIAGMKKTWKLLVSETSALCWKMRVFGADANKVSEQNIRAFLLYSRLGTTEIFRLAAKKVANDAGFGYENWNLVGVHEDVVTRLKNDISNLSLEQVTFWLKNYEDKMSDDFKKAFRIEFVRKNGKINLE